jgi:dTMP kinase
MSLLISFEGIEGCGKTTQAELLNSFFTSQGYPCLVTREPGGTKIGDQIRSVLLHPENSHLTLKAELFLYLASRAQHVEEIIVPALKEGKIIICDRFVDSTVVYQGLVQGIDLAVIDELNQMATSGITPDLTFFIDCPVEKGLKRALERCERKDQEIDDTRFENKELDFHYKVRNGYLELARRKPGRIKVIDGDRDVMVIHREISSLVSERLERTIKGLR